MSRRRIKRTPPPWNGKESDDHVIHPTKGYRRVSPVRMQAASLHAYLKRGYGADLRDLRDEMRRCRETGDVR